jgi:acyl dehydratase
MVALRPADLQVGRSLPPLEKPPVTKTQILRYAGASGDDNLIHTDVETARERGLDGVIAHGMLSMGFLGHYLTYLAGPGATRSLRVRFAGMVRLGDVLTCRGTVISVGPVAGGKTLASLDIWAENQLGEKVTVGDAEVFLEAASSLGEGANLR